MNIMKDLKEEVLAGELKDTLVPILNNIINLIEDFYYSRDKDDKRYDLIQISSRIDTISTIFDDLSYDYEPENNPGISDKSLTNILLRFRDVIFDFINNFNEDKFSSFNSLLRFVQNSIDVSLASTLNESYLIDKINEAVEVHDKLNPKLWDSDNNLKSEVLDALREIADEFLKYIEIPIDVIDIELVGSNASYNYNDKSDIDLHIITNFELNYVDEAILQQLYNSKKNSFNQAYDLSINGIPVELYIQDVKSNNASLGVYSLLEDRWIKIPKPQNYKIPDISGRLSEVNAEVDEAINSNDPDKIKEIINKLYLMRQRGLADGGESSIDNLVFKELRNNDRIKDLKDKYYELRSEELSIR